MGRSTKAILLLCLLGGSFVLYEFNGFIRYSVFGIHPAVGEWEGSYGSGGNQKLELAVSKDKILKISVRISPDLIISGWCDWDEIDDTSLLLKCKEVWGLYDKYVFKLSPRRVGYLYTQNLSEAVGVVTLTD